MISIHNVRHLEAETFNQPQFGWVTIHLRGDDGLQGLQIFYDPSQAARFAQLAQAINQIWPEPVGPTGAPTNG